MSYPFLPISHAASATTGAFLSAARTTCGKAAGRMDGERTLILIAATARQSILLPRRLLGPAIAGESCLIGCGPDSVLDLRREEIAPEPRSRQDRKIRSWRGRSGGHPANLFKRRIRDA